MTIKVDGTNGVLQAYDYQTPTTGFSYTFAAGTQVLVMQPATSLATGTITMPASPADGMTITITTTVPIAALTVNANTGQTIVGGGVMYLGASNSLQYVYRLSSTTWLPMFANDLATASEITGTNTTGTVTSGAASLTVGSATGISAGDVIVGQGITPGTYVTSISGTTVTMSANAGATLSAAPVTFYTTHSRLAPASVGGMLCRAWVNFNGTGTVAIRSSYNVSSITDNGTGDYTLNFTTALSDANYACVTGSSNNTGIFGTMSGINFNTAPTTTACRIYTTNDGGGANDPIYVTVAIFR